MARVAILPTCVVDTVAPEVGVATVRVLRALGYTVDVIAGATCCGQPAWNAGYAGPAAQVAATTLDALDHHRADVVCVPAGSCATMIRVFWATLFEEVGDPTAAARARAVAGRVVEFAELVAGHADDLRARAAAAGVGAGHAIAYHHSCHMLRELDLRGEPLEVLAAIGIRPVAWEGDDRCCGFGGTFAVAQPELSVAMADDKLDTLDATSAQEVVGCDRSCLAHLEGRLRRRRSATTTRHLAEVVADALATATEQR